MKPHKLTFGIITIVLAATSLVATEHYGASLQRWYITSHGFYCYPWLSPCIKNIGTFACNLTYTDGSPAHFVITGNVYTKGSLLNGRPHLVGADNCISKLFYNGAL